MGKNEGMITRLDYEGPKWVPMKTQFEAIEFVKNGWLLD